jgi:hypothetical protein
MQLFSNNFKTTLASAIGTTDTSITLGSVTGFPDISGGNTVLLTLESSNRTVQEIVEVTAVVGSTVTVVRGVEGTTPSSFDVGAFVEVRLTAGWLNSTTGKLATVETGAQVNTVTPGNVVTLTGKTIDSATNKVGADNIHYKVKNMTGSTLAVGTVVKVASYEAGEETIRVTPTTSTGDVAIGIVKVAIPQGEVGLVVNTGVVTGINTTGYSVTTVLYQNGVGGLTATKPTSGTYQAVAVALNSKVDGALLVEFSEPGRVNWDDRYYTEAEINSLLTAVTSSGDSVTLTGDVTGTATVAANGSISVATTISAGTITATLNGNATTATTLQTARTINGVSFNGSANITIADSTKIPTTEKGVANGVATLDANNKIPLAQLPDSILGQLEYMGTHNMTTMPTATQKGQYWIASVSGNGYDVGDWAVYNGAAFDKVDNTDAVVSVAGRTGNVVLTKSDVGLGNVDNTSDAIKNVLSAGKWTTPRTLTIGGTGKAVDGSGNVSWTLAEIGAQAELVSASNIKTINGQSILGAGDLTVSGEGSTVTISTSSFTAAEGQTVFSTSYTPQLVQVYVNGSKLLSSDYTATNGTSITLSSGLPAGAFVEVVKFTPYDIIPTVIEVITAVLADRGTALVDSVDYMTPIEIPFSGTIIKVRARTTTGTVSVQFKLNGSNIGSLLNATTTGTSAVVSIPVSAYDLITIDLSNSNGNGLTISMEIQ